MARYGPIRTRTRRAGVVALLLLAYLFLTPFPGRAVTPGTWSVISTGEEHTCALDALGAAWCWGLPLFGQLGDGTSGSFFQVEPVAVSTSGGAPSSYLRIAAGTYHTCGLATDGAVWCWGYGYEGQLGDDDQHESAVPVKVVGSGPGGIVFTSISAGGHNCGLDSEGTAWCWGANTFGQIGDGTSVPASSGRLVPTQVVVTGLAGAHFLEISAGGNHTCGRASDGTVWCWGRNASGQLGDGTQVNRLTPTQISGIGALSMISAGSDTTCGITASGGILKCWGSNDEGQVGTGTAGGAQTSPVAVDTGLQSGSGLNPPDAFASVDPGGHHTCAIALDETAWCWGQNAWGQIGAAGIGNGQSPLPRSVASPSSFTMVVAGFAHTCAIGLDDRAWCWGDNYRGQLGNGDPIIEVSETPVRVAGGATCTQNPPTSACHVITYEVLSFRSIALSSTDAVDFEVIRQGSTETESGPDIFYATTWGGDVITLELAADSPLGIDLLFDVLSIAAPASGGCSVGGTAGSDLTSEPVVLSTTVQTVIDTIDDCGQGTATSADDVTATTQFTLNTSGANDPDTNYTTPVTSTVTYTIDAG